MNGKVLAMALIRMLYGVFSFAAGVLMYRGSDLQQAVRINSVVGSIGPFILLTVSAIGIAGLAAQIAYWKVALLLLGALLMLMGTR